jgi:hypothetical protein
VTLGPDFTRTAGFLSYQSQFYGCCIYACVNARGLDRLGLSARYVGELRSWLGSIDVPAIIRAEDK